MDKFARWKNRLSDGLNGWMRSTPLQRLLTRHGAALIWIASYAVILVISLSCIAAIYSRSNEAIARHLNDANRDMLTKTEERFTSDIAALSENIRQLSQNIRVMSMIYSNDTALPGYKLNVYYLSRDLSSLIAVSDKLAHMYIYNLKENSVVTANTTFSRYYFYRKYYGGTPLGYESWINLMNQSYHYELVPLYSSGEPPCSALALIHSLPTSEKKNVRANIVLVLNAQKILSYLDGSIVKGQTNFLLNDRGEVMFTNLDRDRGELLAKLPEVRNTSAPQMLESPYGPYVVFQSSDNALNWQFIRMVPYSEYTLGIAGDRLSMLLIAGIGLITMLLLIGFILRFNMRHIRNILGILNGSRAQGRDRYPSEYAVIVDRIEGILSSNSRLAQIQARETGELCGAHFSELLTGTNVSDALDGLQRSCGIDIRNHCCAVLLVSCTEGRGPQPFDPAVAAAVERARRALPPGAGLYCALALQELAVVLCVSPDILPQHAGGIEEVVTALAEELRPDPDRGATAALSRWHPSAGLLPEAYAQARDAGDFARITGKRCGVARFGEIFDENSGGQWRLDQLYSALEKIRNNIGIWNADEAMAGIDGFIAQVRNNRALSARAVRFCMNALVYAASSALAADPPWGENAVALLIQCATLDELRAGLADVLRRAERSARERAEGSLLTRAVTQYILQNIGDKALSLGKIAEHLKYSESHLSRTYKAETGMGLLDAINGFRVQKAKSIMQAERINVHRLASRVGFTNTDSFIRVYKKYEGITPGTYMKRMRTEAVEDSGVAGYS